MIAELFVFGTFWFWGLLALAFVLLLIEVVHERWFLAAVTMLATASALHFFGDVHVFTWIKNNPLQFVGGLAGYFAIGVAWAFIKWYLFVADRREKYDEVKRSFQLKHSLPVENMAAIPRELQISWLKHVCREYGHPWNETDATALNIAKRETAPPYARQYKSRIIQWMAYWPWSALWALLDDFIRKLYERAYRLIAGSLQSIADKMFRGVENDFDINLPLKTVSGENES